ncbi:MAG: thioredoxin family protein [Porticoccaceae bacterium]|nr:thioredoxin family protein [Porticoccaceae bacterium]|tara:strand:- start:8310 stop:8549 length:240 start_codon:yes stop_codon:yes gene_type:complete
MREVVLFTAPNCHLCDLAEEILRPLLERQNIKMTKRDVSSDISLKKQYGLRIPVILVHGGIERDWPFTKFQIEKLLNHL